MSEVFRFVAQRPIQRATPQEVAKKLIKAYQEPQPTDLHRSLREKRAAGDLEGMLEAVAQFVSSVSFVSSLGGLRLPLARLDEWLLDRGDEAEPQQVSDQVKVLTGKKPDQLVSTNEYREDRRKTADSLLALAVDPSGREVTREELMRGMHLFGLLERLAAGSLSVGSRDRDDDDNGGGSSGEVYRLLTRGIVALPSDVFPLPPADVQPNVAPDRLSVTGNGAEEEVELGDVLGAIEELKGAFDRASTEDLDEGNGSRTVSDTPWGLPEGYRLSRATRVAAEKIAGKAALDNLPETINVLESESATLGAARVANGGPKTVVPLGAGFVDLEPFREAGSMLDGLTGRLPADALVRAPGVADLKVVRQKLKRYEMGEVAHIENVLKGESKKRVHRRKTATETTIFTETERTEETEHDLQSTERFELQSEATRTAHEDSHLEGGVKVTASYGPTVEIEASAGFALNHSKDESSRQASSYARDVTERSVTRIQERVKEQRTFRTLTEVEETNEHGVDNSKGGDHVVGIYRWVDKIYEAQIFDYGQRLLLEFNVPEPAAFFLHTLANKPQEGITLEKPEPPTVKEGETERALSPADITADTYLGWVQRYQVANVSPPPKPYEVATAMIEEPVVEEGEEGKKKVKRRTLFKVFKELKTPSGYKAIKYHLISLADNGAREYMLLAWTVGDDSDHHAGGGTGGAHAPWAFGKVQNLGTHVEGALPVALYYHDIWGLAVTLEVLCERTEEKLREWQLKTYEAIIRAYFELKSQYDEQVSAAAARQGIGIQGRNPLQNREIEKAELKKATITMLRGGGFEEFDAIREDPDTHYPEIDIEEAQKEGRIVQFFEQAFEWPQMTYVFYPYFWGRKDLWADASRIDDPADPLFASFLRAGAARVVIPVRPGFENMVNHYLATDQIWGGGTIPAVGDPLYISMAQEIQEGLDADSGGTPDSEPWEVRLPTTLAILQQDATLPVIEQ